MEALIIILLIIIMDILSSKNHSSYHNGMRIPKNKEVTTDGCLKKGNNSSSKE